ncbi:hypothetical protein L1987_53364 [Smallanthus sonchifolius]|uniref:Uncharacterized protein n=1 Tax=Smallanthus sonchifolius TaxID=185202 RepID=A0ACB9EVP8_9ASTR|nr:hypothetical protein L1987_53364 [Smallanthus sonchifolius]
MFLKEIERLKKEQEDPLERKNLDELFPPFPPMERQHHAGALIEDEVHTALKGEEDTTPLEEIIAIGWDDDETNQDEGKVIIKGCDDDDSDDEFKIKIEMLQLVASSANHGGESSSKPKPFHSERYKN